MTLRRKDSNEIEIRLRGDNLEDRLCELKLRRIQSRHFGAGLRLATQLCRFSCEALGKTPDPRNRLDHDC